MHSCRFCNTPLEHVFVDLGHQPPSNSFLTKEQLEEPETYYPLKVFVCTNCWLVQIPEAKKAGEIFKEDYPYYSSQSPSNVSHAKQYADMMCDRFLFPKPYYPGKVFKLPSILEIGSNDGYLLRWLKERGCVVLGCDPAEGPVAQAVLEGIDTIKAFFSKDLATHPKMEGSFDLICGINVLAHQPDINDFVEGLKIALAPDGVITMEFPHLVKLVDGKQFDTIYHEHYNYFSLMTLSKIFKRHQLEIFDVEEIPEHGGSLRIYAQHRTGPHLIEEGEVRVYCEEESRGVCSTDYYRWLDIEIETIKTDLVSFLIGAKQDGKEVIAYGAPAKGNTLLNYCGIRSDLVRFTVDRSPHKQGLFLPGSHIPVSLLECIEPLRPDYVLILPWNLKAEIMEQLAYIRNWGGKFLVAIPELEVL